MQMKLHEHYFQQLANKHILMLSPENRLEVNNYEIYLSGLLL